MRKDTDFLKGMLIMVSFFALGFFACWAIHIRREVAPDMPAVETVEEGPGSNAYYAKIMENFQAQCEKAGGTEFLYHPEMGSPAPEFCRVGNKEYSPGESGNLLETGQSEQCSKYANVPMDKMLVKDYKPCEDYF